jgi:hypothetical protein
MATGSQKHRNRSLLQLIHLGEKVAIVKEWIASQLMKKVIIQRILANPLIVDAS